MELQVGSVVRPTGLVSESDRLDSSNKVKALNATIEMARVRQRVFQAFGTSHSFYCIAKALHRAGAG